LELTDGRNRTDAHDGWLTASHAVTNYTSQRGQLVLQHCLLTVNKEDVNKSEKVFCFICFILPTATIFNTQNYLTVKLYII
jgi:hypothetical protein